MNVGDILKHKTARTRIPTVRMNETVETAVRLMRNDAVRALVVKDVCRTEGNTAVGMFTEGDVARAMAKHGQAGLALKVGALISVQKLIACSSADTLETVAALMHHHHIRQLPVIDDHILVGVIGLSDLAAVNPDLAAQAMLTLPRATLSDTTSRRAM